MKKKYNSVLSILAFANADTASWGKLVISELTSVSDGTSTSTSLGLIKEGSVSFNDNGTENTLYSTGHVLEALKKLTEVEIAFQLILPNAETLNSYVDSTGSAKKYTFIPEEGSVDMTANNAIMEGTPMWAEDTGFYVDCKLKCTPPTSGSTFSFEEKKKDKS